MTNHKPLFGTVSHDKGIFTLHYHKEGNCSGINRQGYDKSVFDNVDIPVIRFDKSNIGDVLECIKGEVWEIEEYYNCSSPWSKPVPLNSYLEHCLDCGIPVETGYID